MHLTELLARWTATETAASTAARKLEADLAAANERETYAERLAATIQANDAIWAGRH